MMGGNPRYDNTSAETALEQSYVQRLEQENHQLREALAQPLAMQTDKQIILQGDAAELYRLQQELDAAKQSRKRLVRLIRSHWHYAERLVFWKRRADELSSILKWDESKHTGTWQQSEYENPAPAEEKE